MKCIYFVQYFPPEKSSGSDLVEDLLEAFVKQGWKIDVYTPTPTRGVTKEQRKEYIKRRTENKFDGKLTIHRMRLYKEGTNFIARALRYFIFSIECFWKAVTVKADFIFTGSGPPTQGIVMSLAKKVSKKKFIYNLQDIFPDSLVTAGVCSEKCFLMKIGQKMENFTYRNADVIITITEDMKTNVLGKGVNPEKVFVVRNWIDLNRIVPVYAEQNKLYDEMNLPRGNFYVVYAGNLGKVQGVEVIVEAAEKLKEHTDIHFVIFGNGSEEESINSQIYEKKLLNISLFPLQTMDRVSEVYSLGDISIIPGKPGTGKCGMPSKTWTIMATGTAILGSFDLDSEMDKILREADCGFCVEAGNAEKLADAIVELSHNPQRVKQMGENARKYAAKYIAKEQSVGEYIKIIEKIVGEK